MPSFTMKGDRDPPPGISVIKSFLDSHPLTSANRFCQIGANDAKALKSAFEKLDYLKNVQEIFKSFNGPNIRFIESVGSVSEVHEKVLTEIDDLFDFK